MLARTAKKKLFVMQNKTKSTAQQITKQTKQQTKYKQKTKNAMRAAAIRTTVKIVEKW